MRAFDLNRLFLKLKTHHKMARTPKQIAQHAAITTDRIISDLYDFIERHDIDKAAIAHKLGVSRTSISTRVSKTGEPKLSNLIKTVLAIEDLTGAKFETPTLTREKGASNAKFKGAVKNEGK